MDEVRKTNEARTFQLKNRVFKYSIAVEPAAIKDFIRMFYYTITTGKKRGIVSNLTHTRVS